jgi:hypothetical protein
MAGMLAHLGKLRLSFGKMKVCHVLPSNLLTGQTMDQGSTRRVQDAEEGKRGEIAREADPPCTGQ